ncbi:hypothetical protein SUGI_0939500 [Cryptomeria japonica]|uniref:stress-response A/B barrel domain-containing protein HS1 n=1 Tax=Cryptomeria japonica TaxID=3369 RepID=UPI002414CBC5|nr:stress-response A/B barrel domain-containing protein HS1 [Cryptomeria japonica]GLJ44686.1 hypothetical protein SUGI_0939500 [Cryptomeria japonica]
MAEKVAANDARHTVLAKFKADLSAQELEQLIIDLEDLCSNLDFVKSFEWGTDLGEVKRQKGFTHIFVITFYEAGGLAEYVSHPAHKAYAIKFMASIEDILILDYQPSYTKSNITLSIS